MNRSMLTFLLGVACLTLPFKAAYAAPETCNLAPPQEIQQWAFKINLQATEPTWSADKAAKDLLRMQSQYFSNKSSPFMRAVIAPTLSFYNPGISMTIDPRVTYSRTLAGKTCAAVVGVTLNIKHAPNVMLAKELVERSCVAQSALNYQLRQHTVTQNVLKELIENQDKIKQNVFDVYKNQGAVGRTEREIGDALVSFQSKGVSAVYGILNPYLRQQRRGLVETPQNLDALVKSCDGQFQKATDLVGLH